MTFPAPMFGPVVEILTGSTWVDITDDVRTRELMRMARGRTPEGTTADPQRISLQLNNANGKYSPRNPISPYWNKIGRNTNLRAGRAGQALKLTSGGVDGASTPDGTAVSITGDIDIRIDLDPYSPDTWASDNDLITKWGAAGQRSFALIMFASGKVSLRWSADGTNGKNVLSSVPVPGYLTDRLAVRATLDVNNGAGSHVVTFYTAPTIDGPWTQLGTTGTATGGGTTSIFDSTTALRVGAAVAGSADAWASAMVCDVYAAELRNGIDGTVVANPDFTAQADGITSFTDAAGRTWTLFGAAVIGQSNGIVYSRFYGEIAELPPRWDTSGNDAWMPIVANGALRRTNAGDESLNSGLNTYYRSFPLLDYWPLDDGTDATLGSNADGSGVTDPFIVPASAGKFGADFGVLGTGLGLVGAGAYASIGSSMAGTVHVLDFTIQTNYPTNGLGQLDVYLDLYNASTVWNLAIRHDGTNNDFRLYETHVSGGLEGTTALADVGPVPALGDLSTHHVRLSLTESGSDVNYAVYVDGSSIISGTHTGVSLGGMRLARFDFTPITDGATFVIGNVAPWDDTFPAPPIATTAQAAAAWRGETAGRRFERLNAEAGYAFTGVGDLDDSMPMGPQYRDYLANQLTEIEATDQGRIYEAKDRKGNAYRTRTSMYRQTPKFTLNYTTGQLAPPIEPVDDDQQTRNDVFAQRRDGASYRATQETGPLNVQDPEDDPQGVGRYKYEVPTNPETDAMLPWLAGWFLGRGTLDQARYPKIVVDLKDPNIYTVPGLVEAILGLDVGDRFTVTNLQALNIYDGIDVLLLGYDEELSEYEHTLTLNCEPAALYDVLVIDGTDSRIDPGDTLTLGTGVNSSATSIQITSTGSLVSTSAGDYPCGIMMGGEEMTLTAVTGASSPQTGTVARSQNGVVKAQTAGTPITLKVPGLIGM